MGNCCFHCPKTRSCRLLSYASPLMSDLKHQMGWWRMGNGCSHMEDGMQGNKNPPSLVTTRSTHKGYPFLVVTNPAWNSLLETVTWCDLHFITTGLLKCLCYIKKLLYNCRIFQKGLVENIGMLFFVLFCSVFQM